jgi:hypothetical protein
LSNAPIPAEEDLADATEHETALLEAIWVATAESDATVPAPESFDETLVRVPRIAERALNALAKSKYLSSYAPLRFFGDLKQVDLYMNDGVVHGKVLDRVLPHITSDTRIVIGHSLGSVVAYEAVCKKPEAVVALLTLGSPLGLRNVVFDKLTPQPDGFGLGRWPGNVKQWTNIAASGDIVAAQKQLAPLFGDRVNDVMIQSGWEAHNSTRYLNSRAAGSAIATGLG